MPAAGGSVAAGSTGGGTVPAPNPSTRTPDMMPYLGHKSAPRKFKGKYEKVKKFIKLYNRFANSYNCTDGDKCELIVDYCSKRVVKLIEGLKSYQDKDWDL
jgi:hypothetical protein